jgi:K+-transporting ATPase KdpF subunit
LESSNVTNSSDTTALSTCVSHFNDFLTPLGQALTISLAWATASSGETNVKSQFYERPDLHWNRRDVLHQQRALRPPLRETLGGNMENLIVGVIALLLFVYLFVAMIRPERF